MLSVGPRTLLILVVLTIVMFAGFGFAGLLGAIFEPCLRGQTPRTDGIGLLAALVAMPNLFAFWLFHKVWRSDESWTALGHRRKLWQIFVSTAFGLGIAAVIALTIMHHT